MSVSKDIFKEVYNTMEDVNEVVTNDKDEIRDIEEGNISLYELAELCNREYEELCERIDNMTSDHPITLRTIEDAKEELTERAS